MKEKPIKRQEPGTFMQLKAQSGLDLVRIVTDEASQVLQDF